MFAPRLDPLDHPSPIHGRSQPQLRRAPRARCSLSLAALTAALALTSCLAEPGSEFATDDTEDDDSEPDVLGFEENSRALGQALRFTAPQVAPVLLPFIGGQASADVDLDADDDVLFVGGAQGVFLLENRGDGSFANREFEPSVSQGVSGPVFADFDLDADPDLAFADAENGSVVLLFNQEGEGFEDVSASAGLAGDFAPGVSVSAADVDGDGDLDLFVARLSTQAAHDPRAGSLWLNDGTGAFSDGSDSLPSQEGEFGVSAALFTDLDHDGKADLVLAQPQGPSEIWLNTSTPDEPSWQPLELDFELPAAFTAQAADLDNDHNVDVLWSGVNALSTVGTDSEVDAGAEPTGVNAATDAGVDAGADAATDAGTIEAPKVQVGTNALLLNRAEGFELLTGRETLLSEVSSATASCLEDFNNDGRLDLLQVAPRGAELPEVDGGSALSTRLLLQSLPDSGELVFFDATSVAGLADLADGRSLLCLDFDADGDLDVFSQTEDGALELYENTLDPEVGGTFVDVRLEAPAGHASLVGARVTATFAAWPQVRELHLRTSGLAQTAPRLHFGLAGYAELDELLIEWPDGAEDTVLTLVPANDTYTLKRRE